MSILLVPHVGCVRPDFIQNKNSKDIVDLAYNHTIAMITSKSVFLRMWYSSGHVKLSRDGPEPFTTSPASKQSAHARNVKQSNGPTWYLDLAQALISTKACQVTLTFVNQLD